MTLMATFQRHVLLLNLLMASLFAILPALIHSAEPAPPAATASVEVADKTEAQELAARRQTIEEEQASVARERRELDALRAENARQLKALDIGQIVRATVEQAELDADAARVNLGGVEVELQSAVLKVESLQTAVEALQERL